MRQFHSRTMTCWILAFALLGFDVVFANDALTCLASGGVGLVVVLLLLLQQRNRLRELSLLRHGTV